MIKTENLTILFVDIAGFTATTSRQSRMENARLLQNFGTTLLPLIKNFKGRLIKTIGDALLITFRSPTDAMLCSMALQDAIHGYNLSASEGEKIHIRVAANLGEVRVTKNDIFGEPVNVASRIEGVAPADEIYLSEAVYMAMNKAEVPAVEVGSKELAGVPHPVRLYNIPRFSTHRLVSENIGGEEQGSELIYPYGGMHYYQTRSGTLSSFLNFIDSRKVANFFISALAVSVVAIAIVVGYHFINKPLSERLAGKQAITNERQLTSIETPIIQQQSKTEEPISLKSGGNEETAQDNEITVTETDSEESVQIPAKIVTKSPIKKTAETPKVTSLASIETSSTKTETVARQQTTKTATAKTETVASPKTTETSSTKTEPVTSQQTTKTASTKNENVSGEKLLAGKDLSTLTPVTNIISTPEKGPASGPIESDIGETKSDASKKEIGEVISAPLTYAARRDTIDTIDTVDTISTTDAIDTTDILDTTDWDVYKARQAYRQSKITADEYNRIVRALQTGSMPSAAKKETTETIDAKDITQWNLIKARQAYRESKISKDDYNRILKELKIAYDNKIDQLNLDLKSGKISRNEYLEDVRKARLEYQGE